VQSAFVVATYPSLGPPASHGTIAINILLFSSLSLSLMCAFVGILRKDQLRRYMLWTTAHKDAREEVLGRQTNFESHSGQNLWKSAEQLSRGLALSIGLFAAGIVIFLCTLNLVVALVVCLFACVVPDLLFPGRGLHWSLQKCYDWCHWQILLAWGKLWRVEHSVWMIRTYPRLYRWITSWDLPSIRPSDPKQTDFGYLSRAILRAWSREAYVSLDAPVDTHLVPCVFGLHRLPDVGHHIRKVPSSGPSGNDSPRTHGLGNAVDLILGILKQLDPLDGVCDMPASLRSRVWRRLTIQQYTPHMRSLPFGIAPTAASVLPWLRWVHESIRQLDSSQRCFLAEMLSHRLLFALRANAPLRGTDLSSPDGPEEPFLAAFCLAAELHSPHHNFGSSMIMLQQVLALAAVRMQTAYLPSSSNTSGTTGANGFMLCSDLGVTRFVKWVDVDLQEWVASKIRGFHDEYHLNEKFTHDSTPYPGWFTEHVRRRRSSQWKKPTSPSAEFAASTFLRAAYSTDMSTILSLENRSWSLTAQGSLFLVSSLHALRALKRLRGQRRATTFALRPQTLQLALCLTSVLRHEVVSRHREQFKYGWLGCKLLSQFPWHSALGSITDCLPVEMGALVRFVVQQEKMLTQRARDASGCVGICETTRTGWIARVGARALIYMRRAPSPASPVIATRRYPTWQAEAGRCPPPPDVATTTSDSIKLGERVLSSLTALSDIIPRNEEADRQLQSELALVHTWPGDIVVSDLEPQGSHVKTSPAVSHHGDAEAHGSAPAGDPRATGADGPHCPHVVIDVHSHLELPQGASTTATPALTQRSTVHVSNEKGTDSGPDLSPEASAVRCRQGTRTDLQSIDGGRRCSGSPQPSSAGASLDI
jgi:hypothetical protein